MWSTREAHLSAGGQNERCKERKARSDTIKVKRVVGTVENLGTLRRQAADLSTLLGDHGVAIAIDQATNGRMMMPEVRHKYNHFFTHWAVLAIVKPVDSNRNSTSVPTLLGQLRDLRDQG